MQFAGSTRGSAATEFALTVTPFLILLFGIINCALAVYAYGFVAYAAQNAARFAAVHGSLSAAPASADAIASLVVAQAAGLKRNHLKVICTWSPNNHPGSAVMVRVQYRFFFAIPILPLPPATFTGIAQMTVLD